MLATDTTLTLRAACDAMHRLNQLAKSYPLDVARRRIYALKTALIKHLYENGYAVAVTQETQALTCWKCGGSNLDPATDEPPCPHCDTGIHTRYLLYAFVFVVDGRAFAWHQPAEQVDYAVTLTDGNAYAYTPDGYAPVMREDVAFWRRDAGIVMKVLQAHGIRTGGW